MDGFIIVNKPGGWSSHDAVAFVRRTFDCRRQKIKVGHTGTLDPMATGVLPIALGRATRLAEYLCDCRKSYRATVCLGVETDSYDADGRVVERRDPSGITIEAVQAALERFTGPIEQVPPMVSALKKDGQPLYKLARAGIEVERPARPVTIYDLRLVSENFCAEPGSFVIDVTCSRGTYIRSLAHDMGAVLGVGGCLTALQRTAVGPFTVAEAYSPEQITQFAEAGDLSFMLPPVQGIGHLPLVAVSEAETARLRHGLTVPYSGPELPLCRVERQDGLLIGIGRTDERVLTMTKVLVDSNDE